MGKIADGEWEDATEERLDKAIAEALDDFGADFDEEGNPLEEGESDRIKSEEERRRAGRAAGEQGEEGADEEGDSSRQAPDASRQDTKESEEEEAGAPA
jgi:F-type H+-transporting ATPase subunit alpha